MAIDSPQQRKKLGESLYTRALGLASEGHLDEAEHHFEEALNLCPQDARIWFHRGHLHEQMGKLESAIHCYNKARSRDRSNPMFERSWREAVRMLDQLPAVPTDAPEGTSEAPVVVSGGTTARKDRQRETVPAPPVEEPTGPVQPPAGADKAVVDVPLLPVFETEGLEALSTEVFDEAADQADISTQFDEAPDTETIRDAEGETVSTVERIGGTWVLWNSRREDDTDDLDTLRTDSDSMFSNASAATLVVPLDELEDEEDDEPTRAGRPRRNTASFINRRNARILDSKQLSVIGMACLRLIAEGDAEQVVELMLKDKYPDMDRAEAHFLLATAYITMAEKTLLQARDLEGGLAEHLKTLKLWFEQR